MDDDLISGRHGYHEHCLNVALSREEKAGVKSGENRISAGGFGEIPLEAVALAEKHVSDILTLAFEHSDSRQKALVVYDRHCAYKKPDSKFADKTARHHGEIFADTHAVLLDAETI